MTLNIALVAPIPSASVRIATVVNPGLLPNWRIAYRESRNTSANICTPRCPGPGRVSALRSIESASRSRRGRACGRSASQTSWVMRSQSRIWRHAWASASGSVAPRASASR